jgi:hypothetical protein
MAIITNCLHAESKGFTEYIQTSCFSTVWKMEYTYKTWVYYVISDASPIFMKIGNVVYFRVLITNIITIFGAKADLTPILTKNRRQFLRHISLFACR